MQTFLPYSDFHLSAGCLDNRRLGKQRVEVTQLLWSRLSITGWSHHPASLMWAGHEQFLATYGLAVCEEWVSRGFSDGQVPLIEALAAQFSSDQRRPWWLDHEPFHVSHRSNLLRKRPDWYQRFWPGLRDDLPYFWPTREVQRAARRMATRTAG